MIDRRILVNYRVDLEPLAKVVPHPFRPKRVGSWGVAGICLIRLRGLRPRWIPRFLGITSENAAHRVAVEWEEGGGMREGVYIPRRDTSCALNVWLGGRLFPGEHHRARFDVQETEDTFRIALHSQDGMTRVAIQARLSTSLPSGSIFASIEEASAFFERGSIGYSKTSTAGAYDGLELRTTSWRVEPLEVEHVASSFFEDRNRFPEGSSTFDNALLMRGLPHEWRGRDTLYGPCCAEAE